MSEMVFNDLRTCLRSLRAAVSCGRTERRNRSLHGVNEDFEHRPTANSSGAVDLEQVLKPMSGKHVYRNNMKNDRNDQHIK